MIKQIVFFFIFILNKFDFILSRDIKFIFEVIRQAAKTPSTENGLNAYGYDSLGQEWLVNSEQLTPVGLRQAYLAGWRTRKQHEGFFSKEFAPNEIQINSSPANSTQMTAYAFLTGLYPPLSSTDKPAGKSKLNHSKRSHPPVNVTDFIEEVEKELNEYEPLPYNNQAIPVHIIPPDSIYLNIAEEKVCPPLAKIYQENAKHPKIIEAFKTYYGKYGEKVLKTLGTNLTDFDEIVKFCNILMMNYYANRTEAYVQLNSAGITNTSELIIDSLNILQQNLYTRFYGDDKSLVFLLKSPLMDSIIRTMDQKITKDQNKTEGFSPKLILYSMHDDDLSTLDLFLSQALNRPIQPYVYYSSVLNFKLYKIDQDERKVSGKFKDQRILAAIGQKSKKYQDHKDIYDDYYVEITFDENEVYYDNYSDFRKSIGQKIMSTGDIDKYCELDVMNKFLHIKLWSIFGIMIFGMFTYIMYHKQNTPLS
jgi:hypothetical protein